MCIVIFPGFQNAPKYLITSVFKTNFFYKYPEYAKEQKPEKEVKNGHI